MGKSIHYPNWLSLVQHIIFSSQEVTPLGLRAPNYFFFLVIFPLFAWSGKRYSNIISILFLQSSSLDPRIPQKKFLDLSNYHPTWTLSKSVGITRGEKYFINLHTTSSSASSSSTTLKKDFKIIDLYVGHRLYHYSSKVHRPTNNLLQVGTSWSYIWP